MVARNMNSAKDTVLQSGFSGEVLFAYAPRYDMAELE